MGLGRTMPPPNARCPGRPAGSTGSRCRPPARCCRALEGSASPPATCRSRRRGSGSTISLDPADGAGHSPHLYTDNRGATHSHPDVSRIFFRSSCTSHGFGAILRHPGRRHDRPHHLVYNRRCPYPPLSSSTSCPRPFSARPCWPLEPVCDGSSAYRLVRPSAGRWISSSGRGRWPPACWQPPSPWSLWRLPF